jgi:hypothetical protein
MVLVTLIQTPARKTADAFNIGKDGAFSTLSQNPPLPWNGIVKRDRLDRNRSDGGARIFGGSSSFYGIHLREKHIGFFKKNQLALLGSGKIAYAFR